MTERLHWIDVMKGILIIFVIVGHLGYSCSQSLGFIPDGLAFTATSTIMCIFCVQFYMAAFFFVTGYCTNGNKTIMVQLKKDLLALVIPALVIPRIMNIVTWHVISLSSFCNPFHELPWFLIAMFWARLLFILINKWGGDKICIFSLLSVLGVLGLIYYPQYHCLYFAHACVFALFMYLGHCFRQFKMNPKTMLIFIVAYFLVACLHYKFTHAIIGVCGTVSVSCQYIPSWFMLATLGTLCTVGISYFIKQNKFIEFLGRHSLTIYLTHIPWMVMVSSWMSGYIKMHNGETIPSIIITMVMLGGAILWSSLWSLLFNTKYMKWSLGRF